MTGEPIVEYAAMDGEARRSAGPPSGLLSLAAFLGVPLSRLTGMGPEERCRRIAERNLELRVLTGAEARLQLEERRSGP